MGMEKRVDPHRRPTAVLSSILVSLESLNPVYRWTNPSSLTEGKTCLCGSKKGRAYVGGGGLYAALGGR